MPSGWNKDFVEIFELFSLAERKIKYIEHISTKLSIPSLNQLRYAGKHILDALQEDERSEHYILNITEAKSHCQRAIYDAMEIGILHFRRDILDFTNDYGNIIIPPLLPKYIEYIADTNAIVEEIGAIKDRNPTKSRADKYKQIQKQLDKIKKIALYFEASRPELNKLKEKQAGVERRVEAEDKRRDIEVAEIVKAGRLVPLKRVYFILGIIVAILVIIFQPWYCLRIEPKLDSPKPSIEASEQDTSEAQDSADSMKISRLTPAEPK